IGGIVIMKKRLLFWLIPIFFIAIIVGGISIKKSISYSNESKSSSNTELCQTEFSVNLDEQFDYNNISICEDNIELDQKVTVVSSDIDYDKVGTYSVEIEYEVDGETVTKYVNVSIVDTTPPEILLNGSDTITISLHSSYEDAGYVVSDNYDSEDDIDVTMENDINVNKVGTYYIYYTATDLSGNSTTIERCVIVKSSSNTVSTISSKITGVTTLQLNGTSEVYIERRQQQYTELGCTATDTVDGDITNKISIVGSVNNDIAGTYIIEYEVTNSSGVTTDIKRTVIVRDTIAPVITISDYTKTITNKDIIVTATVDEGTLNSTSYTFTENGMYTFVATDESGNSSFKEIWITNIDKVAPSIELLGDASYYVKVNNEYSDSGATATDNIDGDLTSSIVLTSSLDTSVIGNYTLTYSVVDSAGNSSSITRAVNISGNILSAGSTIWNSITLSDVYTLTFLNTLDIPEGVTVYDIGAISGYVKMWVDESGNATIAADGMIFANEDSSSLFSGLTNLTSISSIENLITSDVTNMSAMFYNCNNLISLDLSSFDTSKVTNMSYMFYNCNSLISLDLSSFDTSKVTNMRYMFSDCLKLESLNVSSFNTLKVNNMQAMFNGCEKLSSLTLTNFNTSNVTNMSYMFRGCITIQTLTLTNFNTSNVTSMSQMFNGCSSLMFLDVSSFNTSRVTTMQSMFSGSRSIEIIDLSKFDLFSVGNMSYMFASCSSLMEVYLNGSPINSDSLMNEMFLDTSQVLIIHVADYNSENVLSLMYPNKIYMVE
ncbi:MAG TPA: BspA family leucine-rich repeat surface protein, partial [Bacilli bacterium]|nr:BspA family leucine-rich repeat surface protein [Bacilli bacterium]